MTEGLMNDAELFRNKFVEATNGMDDESLCRLLRISKPTLNRWKNGDSAPHMIGREAVFTAIEGYKRK